jgi:hypothetical protein
MTKRTSHSLHAGQLEGAILKIEAVHNNGLQESVTIINRGTVAQPMSGWVLASLRGQICYLFPDDFMLQPGICVAIHSGQQEPRKAPNTQSCQTNLLWTTGQVWNNHWDTAILFDANGLEIDRHSYPHERVMMSSASRQKVLIRHDDGFEIADAPLVRAKKVTRKQNKMIAN